MPHLPTGVHQTTKPRLADSAKIGLTFIGILIFIAALSWLMYMCASRCVAAELLMRHYRKGDTSSSSPSSGKKSKRSKKSKKASSKKSKAADVEKAGDGTGAKDGGKEGPKAPAGSPAPASMGIGGLFG